MIHTPPNQKPAGTQPENPVAQPPPESPTRPVITPASLRKQMETRSLSKERRRQAAEDLEISRTSLERTIEIIESLVDHEPDLDLLDEQSQKLQQQWNIYLDLTHSNLEKMTEREARDVREKFNELRQKKMLAVGILQDLGGRIPFMTQRQMTQQRSGRPTPTPRATQPQPSPLLTPAPLLRTETLVDLRDTGAVPRRRGHEEDEQLLPLKILWKEFCCSPGHET